MKTHILARILNMLHMEHDKSSARAYLATSIPHTNYI